MPASSAPVARMARSYGDVPGIARDLSACRAHGALLQQFLRQELHVAHREVEV